MKKTLRLALGSVLVGLMVFAGTLVVPAQELTETCADFFSSGGVQCPSECECPGGYPEKNCRLFCALGPFGAYTLWCSDNAECITDPPQQQ